MLPLTADRITSLCSPPLRPRTALEAALGLGPFAKWWLKHEVLRLASSLQPTWQSRLAPEHVLPCRMGSCCVILVLQAPLSLPLLRPAFPLPLRWIRGSPAVSLLPQAIEKIAHEVRVAFPELAVPETDWQLSLDFEENLEIPDLRTLEVTAESAWGSLASGLLLAADGLTPHSGIWVSVARDPYSGVGTVGGLREKLALAMEHRVSRFFLPLQQRAEAEVLLAELPQGNLRLEWLAPQAAASPRQILRPLLACLGMPPGSETPLEVRARYFALQSFGSAEVRRYYQSALLPDLTTRLRRQVLADWPDWQPHTLVTILSGSTALVPLITGALGVRQVLLLHTRATPDDSPPPWAKDMVSDLQARGLTCQLAGFTEGPVAEMRKTLRHVIETFLGQDWPENFALDMTPGKKSMTLALAGAAPPGTWLVYCRSEHQLNGGPIPGTECIERWHSGLEPQALPPSRTTRHAFQKNAMAIIPTLRCSTMKTSVAFYTEILDFECVAGQGELQDPCFCALSRRGDILYLSSHRGDGVFGQAVVILTEEIDALVRQFRQRGLKTPGNPDAPQAVHEGPIDQTWGTREFYVQDPDGNTLRFTQA